MVKERSSGVYAYGDVQGFGARELVRSAKRFVDLMCVELEQL